MAVGEAAGNLQGASTVGELALHPLLSQQIVNLLSGQGFDHQAVAERLHRERLAVGDAAVAFARCAAGEGEVGADTAWVHEGHHGATFVHRRRRGELGIGDHVAERGFARAIAARGDVCGDAPDDAVRDRGGEGVVVGDDTGDFRHWPNGFVAAEEVVPVHQHVGRAHLLEVPRRGIDGDVDAGEQRARRNPRW